MRLIRPKRALAAGGATFALLGAAVVPAAAEPPAWTPGPPPMVGELVAEVFDGVFPWGTDSFPPGLDLAAERNERNSLAGDLPVPDDVLDNVPSDVPNLPSWVPGPPDGVDAPPPNVPGAPDEVQLPSASDEGIATAEDQVETWVPDGVPPPGPGWAPIP